MACSDYSFFSPSGWVCSFSSAIVKGGGGGIKALLGINTSSGGQAGKETGANAAEFVKDFFKSFFETGKFDAGGTAGAGLHDITNNFWDAIKLPEIFQRAATEFNKAGQAGIKNAGVSDNMGATAKEFGDGADKVREVVFKLLDGIREDFQHIISNTARDTVLKVIPWVALGGAVLIGTPLFAFYMYNKAKHNIGRPKLASEVRYVGLYNRTTDAMANLASATWKSISPGMKWTAITTASGFAGSFTYAITDEITAALLSRNNNYPIFPGAKHCSVLAGQFLSATGNLLEDIFSPHYHRSRWETDHLAPFMIFALSMGLLATTYTAGSLAQKAIKKWYKKEPRPIFSPALTTRIENITKATYNIQKHGGFFQNVLLYGPGGTGKTMISKIIAQNSNMNYIMMSGGDLAQYIKRGEHVTELNKIFVNARSAGTPTILFIDEAESICRDRDKVDKPELIELLNALLNQTGEPSNQVMLILTTNRPEDLDPAVLSRMDHKLFISPPELTERTRILNEYLPSFFSPSERREFFTDAALASISEQTAGLTGRALFKMLNALAGNKNSTANNALTREMIETTVNDFVRQEREMAALRDRAITARTATTPSTTPTMPAD